MVTDAVRSCLLYRHCTYTPSSPGYGEYTPGIDAALRCEKRAMRHARGDNLFDAVYTRQQLREALHTASTCKHYIPDEVTV